MEDKKKPLTEKVHDLYFKVFPGADCPVTGASREKLIAAAQSSQRKQQEQFSPCSSASSPDPKPKYKHPHVYDVYGRRVDRQASERKADVWRMPSFLYTSSFYDPGKCVKRDGSLEEINPVKRDGSLEEINPANRMPLHASQQPSVGQKEFLSTVRRKSTIPKAGMDDTWLYPSPQMFFNSLVRKNKADDVTEKDMEAVVATHNAVNEVTWSLLLRWEQLYATTHPEASKEEPRLLHFRGRPTDLTPKAYIKKFLGFGVPFDRHDWTVDRGGREMRYVIDFYYDETKDWPFFVDVRPALDSPAAVLLRAKMLMHNMIGKVPSAAPNTDVSPEVNSHSNAS